MKDHVRKSRVSVQRIAFALALSVGCESAPDHASDPSHKAEIETRSDALTAGRSVRVGRQGAFKDYAADSDNDKTIRRPVSELFTQFGLMCLIEAIAHGVPTSSREFCGETRTYRFLGPWWDFLPAAARPFLHLCVATHAMHAAESATDNYLEFFDPENGLEVPYWTHKPGTPPEELAKRFPENTPKIPFLTIPSPTSSDAASFALLATEQYREAVILATDMLETCALADLQAQLPDVTDGRTWAEDLSATLSEAMLAMEDSAALAQENIAAAAAARTADMPDVSAARITAWRARRDSKLEGASVYVDVPGNLYEGRGVPLFEMVSASTRYYTTRPNSPLAGTARGKFIGFVYSPDGPAPPNSKRLGTYRKSGSTTEYLTLDRTPASGGTWSLVQTEGWVLDVADASAVRYGRFNSSSTTGPLWTLAPVEGPTPGGYTAWRSGTDEDFWLFPNPPANPIGDHPVLTSAALTSEAKRAEELLRSTRVNPCLQGMAPPCFQVSPSRDVLKLADDLLLAIKADTKGFTNVTGGAALLSLYGLKSEDLSQAADRLVQEARVLGRPFVADTNSTAVPRVFGTQKQYEAVHPWYLYAVTESNRVFATSKASSSVALNLPTDYPHRGIFHAIDGFREAYYRIVGRTGLGTPALKLLDNLHGYARTQVTYTVTVSYIQKLLEGNGTVYVDSNVTVYIKDSPVSGAAAVRERFDAWLNEDGLVCATAGTLDGVRPCTESKYKFAETEWSDQAVPGRSAVAARLKVGSLQAPSGVAALTGLGTSAPPRIYITEKTPRGRKVIAGFTLKPVGLGVIRYLDIPSGPGLEAALQNALAADPYAPGDGALSCAGVSRSQRIPLESSLEEATTGSDLLESSFSYYLGRARTLATRADRIGDDLVEQGLVLDQRAEAARDALEETCGVVLNLDSLDEVACDTAGQSCDLMDALSNSDAVVENDLGALKECLGTNGNDPLSWAALGRHPLCMWQTCVNATTGRTEPCPASPTATQLANPCHWDPSTPTSLPFTVTERERIQCLFPVREPDARQQVEKGVKDPGAFCLEQMRSACQERAAALSVSAPCSTDGLVGFLVADHAAEPEGEAPQTPQVSEQPADLCVQMAEFRAGTQKTAPQLPWSQPTFREEAEQVGLRWDYLGNAFVTRAEGEWLATGTTDLTMLPDPQGRRGTNPEPSFPCMGYLDTLDCAAGADTGACGLVQRLRTACYSAAAWDRPLLCGIDCANPSDVDRVARAVELARTLAGQNFAGFQARVEGVTLENTIPLYGSDDELVEVMNRMVLDQAGARGPVEQRTFTSQTEDKKTAIQRKGGFTQQEILAFRESVATKAFLSPEPVNVVSYCHTSGQGAWGSLPRCSGGDYDTAERTFLFDVNTLDWPRLKSDELVVLWNRLGGKGANLFEWFKTHKSDVATFPLATPPEPKKPACSAEKPCLSYGYMEPFVGDGRTYRYRSALANFTRSDLMDTMELMCLASYPGDARPLLPALRENTVAELVGAGNYRVLADLLRRAAERASDTVDIMYVANVPRSLIEELRTMEVGSRHESTRGTYGESVFDLVRDLRTVPELSLQIADLVRQSAAAIELAESRLRELDIEKEISQTQEAMVIHQNSMRCQAAMLEAAMSAEYIAGDVITIAVSAVINKAFAFAQGAMTCAGADAQGDFARQIQNAELRQILEKARGVVLDLSKQLGSYNTQMSTLKDELERAYSNVHRDLAKLEAQRNSARSLAARALLMSSDGMGRQFNVNTAMRARMSTLRVRYREAHADAKRVAFLARRAIEQRLGVDMSLMTKPMSLVPAPRAWADTLCSLPAIDYEKVRKKTNSEFGEPYNYAASYVGDYVTLLENFLDSYRQDYPFQDGQDLVIASLRDDILGVYKGGCKIPGPNLLHPSTIPYGKNWEGTCSSSGPSATCVLAVPEAVSPFADQPVQSYGQTSIIERSDGFAGSVRLESGTVTEGLSIRTVTPSARYQMQVELSPGRYWLSWYAPGASSPCRSGVTPSVELEGVGPVSLTGAACTSSEQWLSSGWIRQWVKFRVDEQGTATIGFSPISGASFSTLLAAPQLEQDELARTAPREFFPADEDGLAPVGRCPDTQGEAFRSEKYWTYGCEYYCPPGTGLDCSAGGTAGLPKQCFYETRFQLPFEEVEQGELFRGAGFALGNINYRIAEVAVNVVGSAIKDCASATYAGPCYANNFLQYSLRQDGPFRVRNYNNDVFEAPLFAGSIQSAKALLAERYLANPIAGADENLLEDYWRNEFRGRPLDGSYRLRIYDTDGLSWDRIEDIQLAVRYRYWTPVD